jgi:hypothetical protein
MTAVRLTPWRVTARSALMAGPLASIASRIAIVKRNIGGSE